jgi:hypothetical protein
LQVGKNTVIPAKAGIQREYENVVSLDPRLRGGDEKNKLANGVWVHTKKSVDTGLLMTK